jgi:hypothetical protein
VRKSKKSDQTEGKVEQEVVKGVFKHYSIIISVDSVKLPEIPTGFLIMDYPGASIKNREDCYSLFQSFYQSKIDFEKQQWYLFILIKSPIKKESETLNNYINNLSKAKKKAPQDKEVPTS